MQLPRSSGILLHPTSLPGPHGIGDLGRQAYAFADFLASAGQRIWQMLPLGPTGYGDSPYQLFSAFAGNPLLLNLEMLGVDAEPPRFPPNAVDFGWVIDWKFSMLREAHEGFARTPEFDLFCERESPWLDDFALFIALKEFHGVEHIWTEWEPDIAAREPDAVAAWTRRLGPEMERLKYWQFEFFRQWGALKTYCHERGILIMGDVPIYVAHDSADVWSHPDLFQLDGQGKPAVVAGVPPDYFSSTGQLWGNPIYRWREMAESGFAWWIDRFRASVQTLDLFRLDHFRGFEAYWEVPSGEATARNGRWVEGPGMALFEAAERALGELPMVAENLGVITPGVEAMRARFGFPGMSILQFAFGKDPQSPDFKPHNYPRDRFAYTGTHDNDTVMGWWNSSGAGDSTRTQQDVVEEKAHARKYLGSDGSDMNWILIRALMASVANAAIVPLQDVLGLGSEARMNIPGTPSGNWRWRFREGDLHPDLAARLKDLAMVYDRYSPPPTR